MVLAIDIGNTNIVVGGFLEDELQFVLRIATDVLKTEDEYASKIMSVLSAHEVKKSDITGCIISSVVPPLTNILKKAISFSYGVEALSVCPGIKTGINIHCDDPSSVGADLITACVGCHNIYGSPALIIDMGTATKMIIMDKVGTFSGAVIIPGVNMGLKSLSSGTAQLPQISLEAPASVIGKNTLDCMRSGVVFGNASLLDGMIDRIFEGLGTTLPVYATGGLCKTIVAHCHHEITVDENLLLKGLNIIYKKNC